MPAGRISNMAGRVDSQDMGGGVNEYHQGSRPRRLDSQSGNDADADSEKSPQRQLEF